MLAYEYTNSIRSEVDERLASETVTYTFFSDYEENEVPRNELIFPLYEKLDDIVDNFFTSLINYLLTQGTFPTISLNSQFSECVTSFFKYTSITSNEIPKKTLEEYDLLKNISNTEFQLLINTIKLIKKYFAYKYISIGYTNLRNKFAKDLIIRNGIHICPYCKRNYINVVCSDDDLDFHIKPDLDHFYPKAYYPFLAITLSNLIPSCQTCNSRLKKEKDFYVEKHLHPLHEEDIFELLKFKYIGENNTIYISNKDELQNGNVKITNTLDTFKIEEVYNSHKEIVHALKNKYKRYNKVKRMGLKNILPTISEREILDVVFFEYRHLDKTKEPLYKLKKDLYDSIVGK